MRRYCLTLKLRPDQELIDDYVERHRAVWRGVLEAQRAVGVVDMEIYLVGATLFMIMEVSDDFTFERKAEHDRANELVMQWEREMSRYQQADADADASGKWQLMPRIFSLKEQLVAAREELPAKSS